MTQSTTSTRLRPFKPTAFGRYTLMLPISTGGMGEIFLARMEGARGFEKLCVIKRILPQLAQDKEFVTRFVNEAKTLAQLSHGSIAQIQDFGMVDGTPFLAIEYVDGKDLRRIAARMRDRNLPMPLTFVLFVMSRVLDALAYAHRKRDEDEHEIGLVHRDVSPQNILISYEGEVKVIDFGLAKSTLTNSNTQPSIVLGKFLYMSPEQARHTAVDRRSDLYSVGLCLYEMIAGRNPFDEIPPGELMHKVASPTIRPLNHAEPLTPPAVAQVVMRALNPDPAMRFQTAEEFRGRLMACLMDIDPQAGPESASRFMRDVFSVEHATEKKLHQSLREQLKPQEEPDAAVRLVVPPPGRPALEPVGPRRDVSPLSFKPTPTSRAPNTDFSDKDRETMPGIMPPEGFNRYGEAETAQVGVVQDPEATFRPRGGAARAVDARVHEPTEPSGVGLQAVPPRPRGSAPPVPPNHGQAQTLPALPHVPGVSPGPGPSDTVELDPEMMLRTDATDRSLLPVSGPPPQKRNEVTRPVAPISMPPPPPPPVASPLDTLPPSGPQPAVMGTLIPEATNAAHALGPTPEPATDLRHRPTEAANKVTSPVVEKIPRALEKAGPPMPVDTQRTKGGRLNPLIVIVPLLAVIGAGAYIGYDLYKEQARVQEHETNMGQGQAPPPPTPIKRREEPTPAPVVEKEKEEAKPVEVVDEDVVSLDLSKPKAAPAKKKEISPATKAMTELENSYTALENESTSAARKYGFKVTILKKKYSPKMSPEQEAAFVQEAGKLKAEINKAAGDIVK